MAAYRPLRRLGSIVMEVVTCPICLEQLDCPKSLPCLHTFCLKCIGGLCRDNFPGDWINCPVCRREFEIPTDGVSGLVNNFHVARLVEARTSAAFEAPIIPVPCMDCDQKLCEQCSRPRSRMQGRQHDMVRIGNEVRQELTLQIQSVNCDKHENNVARLYCQECKLNVGGICITEERRPDTCQDAETAAAESSVLQIDADLKKVGEQADLVRYELSRVEQQKCKFVADVEAVRGTIAETGEYLKRTIDKQVQALLLDAQSLKTRVKKEIAGIKENGHARLLAFETFSAYCSELKANGKSCDITRVASDLHSRATELLRTDLKPAYYCAPALTFTPRDIDALLTDGKSLIGSVTLDHVIDSTQVAFSVSIPTSRQKTQAMTVHHLTENERSIGKEVETCHSLSSDHARTWSEQFSELQARIVELSEREIEMKVDKLRSDTAYEELSTQCERLRTSENELNARVANAEKALNDANRELGQLTQTEKDLRQQVLSYEQMVSDLKNERDKLRNGRFKPASEMPALRRTKMVTKRAFRDMDVQTDAELNQDNKFDKLLRRLEDQVEQAQRRESETAVRLEKSELAVRSFKCQIEELRKGETIMNEELKMAEAALGQLRKSETGLKGELKASTSRGMELQEQLKQVTNREQLLREHLQSVAHAVHKLPQTAPICGMTLLDDTLYVLRKKSANQVDVYNTVSYSLLRQLSVPGLRDMMDMTACKMHGCLYVADYSSYISSCVHRVELNHGTATKWYIDDKPYGLSVTPNFTVLVTCDVRQLLEIRTDGKRVRKIDLDSDVINPWHAIQLPNGQFAVCHGYNNEHAHRICIVDDNGHVIRSYGGSGGSATVGQLNEPHHIAVDKDGFIFVADYNNRRVLLLSPTLSYVREIVSRDQFKWEASRLAIDVDRRRLYVADVGMKIAWEELLCCSCDI